MWFVKKNSKVSFLIGVVLLCSQEIISQTLNFWFPISGSTSLLFLICVSPMAILHVTLSEENLSKYSYQVSKQRKN